MFSTVTNFCCKSWGGFQNVLSVFLSFTLVVFLSLGFSFFVIRELLVVKTVMCLSRAGHLLEASSVFVGLVGGRGREGGAGICTCLEAFSLTCFLIFGRVRREAGRGTKTKFAHGSVIVCSF